MLAQCTLSNEWETTDFPKLSRSYLLNMDFREKSSFFGKLKNYDKHLESAL